MSMEWFRWWHGCISDPKFITVARRAKQPRALVIALWAAILEHASQANPRGSIQHFCLEDTANLLEIDEEYLGRIMDEFEKKGLIQDERIAKWEERQPHREDYSTRRVRQHRDMKRNVTQKSPDETQCNANFRNVTQCNAPEEIRVDTDTDTEQNRERVDNKVLYLNGLSSVGKGESEGETATQEASASQVHQHNPTRPTNPEIEEKLIKDVVALYHQALPSCKPVRQITSTLKEQITELIKSGCLPDLDEWRLFLTDIGTRSPLLTGRRPPAKGQKTPFTATLEWITRPENYRKIANGVYFDAPRQQQTISTATLFH